MSVVRELLELEVRVALVALRLDDNGLVLVRQLARLGGVLVGLRAKTMNTSYCTIQDFRLQGM